MRRTRRRFKLTRSECPRASLGGGNTARPCADKIKDGRRRTGAKMANFLEQLRGMTTVVSDSGDINSIEQFKPTDSTTNPSLIAAAAQMPAYAPIVDDVLKQAR